ncbi:dienelactone hydrolase family protein [Uliginosibacterium flavum]|uniref:Dienelactone hydrolase family protein n=1 Tax=Uliginosibacterium flavum TaxID=1396831 RepID=A0ABV2TJR8_9RHOO
MFSVSLAHATPEPVSIPAGGLSSSPAPLVAHLFQPDAPGPHPAVVMVHGCGGAYAKDGALNARHQMWGEYLASQGYLALMLDSFSSRGLKQICTQKYSERMLKEADRVGDAYAALSWLRQQSGIDAMHIGLLGWSHGGGVTLDVIRRKPANMLEGFSAAVSFYPGCTTRNKKAASFKPYAPLLILIGEADDWTPAASCVALTNTARAQGAVMQIVTYPGAYHDFDHPGLSKIRLRADVPNGVNPGKGVHTGPDPVAREDAKRRTLEFFAGQLK